MGSPELPVAASCTIPNPHAQAYTKAMMKSGQQLMEVGQAAAEAQPSAFKDQDQDQGQDQDQNQEQDCSSSDTSKAALWSSRSTRNWTAQQRAKYANSDNPSLWARDGGATSKGNKESSSAAAPQAPTDPTPRSSSSGKIEWAKNFIRKLSKSSEQNSHSSNGKDSNSNGNSRSEQTPQAAPAQTAFTTPTPYLQTLAPFDPTFTEAFDEVNWSNYNSSSSATSSSGSNATSNPSTSGSSASTSISTGTISGRSSCTTTTPARQVQHAAAAAVAATTTPTYLPARTRTRAPAPAPAPTPAREPWFRPCSESDKRAAKYLINNTASTSNENLAALVREAEARQAQGHALAVSKMAPLRKAALKHRQISEEDWERAVLEDDEYEIVRARPVAMAAQMARDTTATATATAANYHHPYPDPVTAAPYSATGPRGGEKRRKEAHDRRDRPMLLLRPDVRAKWDGLVIDQHRVRELVPLRGDRFGPRGDGPY